MELERFDLDADSVQTINGKSKINRVLVTKIYVAFAARNAWNWTSFNYFSGELSTSLDGAKNSVERKRVQGSSWSIQEIPAIAISTPNESLIFCHIDTVSPFLDWEPPIVKGKYLRNVLEAWISESRPDDWRVFISHLPDCSDLEQAELPFTKYQSSSLGSKQKLDWFAPTWYQLVSSDRRRRAIELRHIYEYAGILATNVEAMLKQND